MTQATAYRYTGAGEFLPGIPARDLTEDDVAALSDEQRALVSDSPLYAKGPGPEAKKTKAAAAAEGDVR